MRKDYTLKDGRTLVLEQSKGEDAKEILDCMRKIGGETDFLLIDRRGIPLSIEQEAMFIEQLNSAPTCRMFTGRVDGKVVCVCDVKAPANKKVAHVGVIGISCLKEYWGLGIGSAMVSTLIDFAKETGVIKLLTLEVHEQNTRAQKLYEKFGFEVVGSHKGKFFVNGNYYDDILMDLSL